MSADTRIKICGLSNSTDIAAAVDAGATYVGFVFFPRSARNLKLKDAAQLAGDVPAGICKVALTVNAGFDFLDQLIETVPLDMLQLHGSETPDQVAGVKDRYRLPVMKAVGVGDETDLPALQEYMRAADQILVDAKPPAGAALPGGNGLTFDWRLIAGRRWAVPWMLAGGLTSSNVSAAIRLTGANQVDVSSAVESSPGIKDQALIREFCKAAKR